MSESPTAAGPSPPPVDGLRVLVIGLGRFGGGVGVTRWLVQQGAEVTVTDLAPQQTLPKSIRAIADLGVRTRFGEHCRGDLDGLDLVVVNPAVDKRRSPFFQEVVRRKIPWTTEINLFCERCPAPVIGVTGSYGKSTTCAMLAEVLRDWGKDGGAPYCSVHLGGNIGGSLLTSLDEIRASDLIVLELSNAQLEDLPLIGWAPPIAVINNLSPHHLDRYGGFDEYVNAKLNIVRDPAGVSRVFVGELDPGVWAILERSLSDQPERLTRIADPRPPIELRVPGAHNQANAAAALAVGLHLGASEPLVRASLGRFKGLPHRLEHVRTIDGVDYFNDSKSTSPTATLASVEALRRPTVVIAGGQTQGVPLVAWAGRIVVVSKAIICVGEAGPAFAEALRAAASADDAEIGEAASLELAVRAVQARTVPGDAVLFSPGAPSFDQYANYAERGAHFVEIVNSL